MQGNAVDPAPRSSFQSRSAVASYSGILGQKYQLVRLAYPHVDEFQDTIGRYVGMYRQPHPESLALVEIGCGDGHTTDALLRARGDMHVAAVDIEPFMIESARQSLAPWRDLRRYDLIVADALEYLENCPESSIDVIASGWTLHNFTISYRSLFLMAAFRALKPQGLFVNGDKYAQSPLVHHECLVLQMSRFFETYLPIGEYEFLREFVLHNLADESPSCMMWEDAAIEEMGKIGFQGLQVVYRKCMEAVIVAYKPADPVLRSD